ncbi:MAG: ankyrin repeat domain-containing protein [Ectothiorhodospiraceae bacterium AqS1]|nr:ankyrin repeat domain-containing protein [Ectothiorhodospiraceae bacterium AqS1]MBF2761672.1 ankyrin repeat domain-containing protein [Ectothiorhodospiraceae bacterium AqS1]
MRLFRAQRVFFVEAPPPVTGEASYHQHENAAGVLALIAGGAVVDAKDEFGRTPLHQAASLAYPEIVKALIDAGADVEETTRDGFTALSIVCIIDNEGTIAALIDAKRVRSIKAARLKIVCLRARSCNIRRLVGVGCAFDPTPYPTARGMRLCGWWGRESTKDAA